jgi:hypothetical protein
VAHAGTLMDEEEEAEDEGKRRKTRRGMRAYTLLANGQIINGIRASGGGHKRTMSVRSDDIGPRPHQGLTLFHVSAQPKPCWSHLLVSPCLIDWGEIMQLMYPMKLANVEPKSGRE